MGRRSTVFTGALLTANRGTRNWAETPGDDTRAESLLCQAVDLRRKAQGVSHPDYAGSLSGLAHLSLDRGDDAGADAVVRTQLVVSNIRWTNGSNPLDNVVW